MARSIDKTRHDMDARGESSQVAELQGGTSSAGENSDCTDGDAGTMNSTRRPDGASR